jgi:hypothetical protein
MALDLTEQLRDIVSMIDQTQDLEALKRRLQGPLLQAFATLGASE